MSYKVIFIDGAEFQGGEVENSKWNEMPDKPIKTIEYTLGIQTIVMTNYEAYNHIVERVQIVNKESKTNISKLILMLKKGDDVLNFIYDYKKNKFYPEISEYGKEYNKKPVNGWKTGVEGEQQKTEFV